MSTSADYSTVQEHCHEIMKTVNEKSTPQTTEKTPTDTSLTWAISSLAHTPRVVLTLGIVKRVIKIFQQHDPKYFQVLTEFFKAIESDDTVSIDWTNTTSSPDEERAFRSVMTEEMHGRMLSHLRTVESLKIAELKFKFALLSKELSKDDQKLVEPMLAVLNSSLKECNEDVVEKKDESESSVKPFVDPYPHLPSYVFDRKYPVTSEEFSFKTTAYQNEIHGKTLREIVLAETRCNRVEDYYCSCLVEVLRHSDYPLDAIEGLHKELNTLEKMHECSVDVKNQISRLKRDIDNIIVRKLDMLLNTRRITLTE